MPDPIVSAFDATPRTRLVFGPGTLARLGALAQELGSTRALIVTDLGIVHAGHAQRAVQSLAEAGIGVAVYDAVRENPPTADVDRCLAVAREAGADLLIGLGGGAASSGPGQAEAKGTPQSSRRSSTSCARASRAGPKCNKAMQTAPTPRASSSATTCITWRTTHSHSIC